jgi:translation initiation factor 2 subunit 2
MVINASDDEESSEAAVIGPRAVSEKSWLNSDRDYTYEELLTRVFEIMHTKNPEMASGTKQKFVMRPPQVLRVGTKKTSFVNFMEICKM